MIMSSKLSSPLVLLTLLVFLALFLKSNADGHIAMVTGNNTASQIAVYWGRDGREGSLTETCSSGNYNIVIISFLSNFGNGQTPEIILDGHCDPSNGGCQILGNDIQTCQNQGVKVFLSVGGPSGSYSLNGPKDAIIVADYLWNTFLSGVADARPFGAAVLDGIDLDIRGGGLFYYNLIKRLSQYRKQAKKMYFTASYPCLYPPKRLAGALLTSGILDYAWIQFYNVYGTKDQCEYDSANNTAFKAAWKWWASQKIGKVFFGTLASVDAGNSGYISRYEFTSNVLPFTKGYPKYGGVMVWNKWYDYQSGFAAAIKDRV